jgi:hypothetical protein
MQDPKTIQLPIYPETVRLEAAHNLGTTNFACDLSVCKGACCTMPADAGAPILQSEIAELERVFPIVKKYLSEESLAAITKMGLWQREPNGSHTIPAIKGRDCIFVMYDNVNSPSYEAERNRRGLGGGERIAYCAIERAYRNGEIDGFPKPISCHLFPIRIYPTGENTFEIVYEAISECKGGRARGKREHIPLLDFLESPIARAIGDERMKRLREVLK